jgi:ubiquinone/menaquinone biosynthesis C-methylase UbiE
LTVVNPQLAATTSGAVEAARWRCSVAAWERWADPLAELADRLNQPLLDAAGIGERVGEVVLDLAAGVGEPALSAARRVGPEGRVIGLDLVPGMAAVAAARAAARGVGGVAFGVADMTALPLAVASVDRVTCRFGVMFVADPAAALAECRRVLRPGGRAAFMVWGPKADNALFEVLEAAVDTVLGPPADGVGGLQSLFRFARAGSLADLLTVAGFAPVTEQALTPVRKVPVGTPFWQATLEMTLGPRLAGATPAQRRRLDEDIEARFAAGARGGTVAVPLHARIVSGVAR